MPENNPIIPIEVLQAAGQSPANNSFISGPELGKNDIDVSPENIANLEYLRARNQSGLDQAATSIGGGVYKGIMTAIEDIGYLGDIENNIARIQGLEDVTSNVLSDWAKERKAEFDEEFPIYKENSDAVFDFSDSASYWQAIQSIVDSAVGFGAVGAGVGGLVTKAAKVSRLANILGKSATEAGVALSSGYITNFAESKMMAVELYEGIMKDYEGKILSGEISEDEVRKIAGEQADQFMLNNKVFMLTDAMALNGIFRGSKFVNNLDDQVKTAYKQSRGKKLNIFERYPKGSELAKQSIGEYGEETAQSILSAEGEYQADLALGEDVSEYSDDFLGRAIDKFLTPETQLEGVLGLFGGGLQSGLAKLPSRIANKAGDELRRSEQLATIDETQASLDQAFKPIAELESQKQRATILGKDALANSIKNEIFAKTALRNFQAGTTEILEEKLSDVAKMSKEEAEALGYEDNYREEAVKQIEKLRGYAKDYVSISNRYYEDKYQPLLGEIFTRKIERDQLLEDVANIRREKEDLKGQILSKVGEQYNYAALTNRVEIPILQDKLQRLITQHRQLGLSKKRDLRTPTGKKTRNKKIVAKINKLYDQIEKQIVEEKEATKTRLSTIKTELDQLEDKATDIGMDNFFEYEEIKLLNTLDNDITAALSAATESYKQVSNKKALDEFLKEEGEVTEELQKEAIKEERKQTETKKKEKDTATIKAGLEQKAKESENKAFENSDFTNAPTNAPLVPQGNALDGQTPPAFMEEGVQPDFEPDSEMGAETVFDEEAFNKPTTLEDNQKASTSNQLHALEDYEGPQEITNKELKKLTETVRDDEENNKIIEAASSLAFLSKLYKEVDGKPVDIGNELNDNLFKKLLSPSISVGTTIELVVDQDYPTYKEFADNVDKVPIAIKIKGETVAYLHDVDYINSNRVVEYITVDDIKIDNIKRQKDLLREIRQSVINSPKKTVKTTINDKFVGHLSKDINNEFGDVSERMPDVTTFAIGKEDQLYVDGKSLLELPVVNDMLKIQNGVTYAIVPTPNGKYMALPVTNKKMDPKVAESLVNVLNIHLLSKTGTPNDEAKEIQRTIFNELDIDIFDINGLRDYFSLFLYKYDFKQDPLSKLDQTENLRITKLIEQQGDKRFINITGNSIQFLQTGKRFYEIASKPSGSKEAVEAQLLMKDKLLGFLEAHIKGMYVNIDLAKLNSNKSLTIPLVNYENGEYVPSVLTYDSYTSFVKSHTETNVRGNDIGDGEYAYFNHPNIFFDTSFTKQGNKPKTEVVKPEKIEAGRGVLTTEVDPRYDKEIADLEKETEEPLPPVKHRGVKVVPPRPSSDLSIGVIQENELSDVLIPGFSSFRQNQVVDILAMGALDILTDKNTKNKIKLGEAFNILLEEDFKPHVKRPEYKLIVDNFEDFKNLTYTKLANIGIVKITRPDNIEVDALEDLDNDLERSNFDDNWSFSINGKDTASSKLKQFLAFIPDMDREGYIPGYLGTSIYRSYDETYEKLSEILADTPNNFPAMRAKLEEYQIEHPWIASVLSEYDTYEGDKERLAKELVVAMSKTPAKMQMVLWKEITETVYDPFTQTRSAVKGSDGKPKKYYSLRVVNSDQNSVTKMIEEQWIENFKNTSLVTQENGELTISKKNREQLIKDIKKLYKAKTTEEIKTFFDSVGINLGESTLDKLLNKKFNRLTFKGQFTNRNGIFFLMNNRLKGSDEVKNGEDQELYKYNPLLNNSGIRSLAREEVLNGVGTYSNSYKNINGDTVFGYSLNKAITHKYKKLLNPDYANKLYDIGFNSNSEVDGKPTYENWIYRLANDQFMRDTFSVDPFDGMRKASSNQKGVQLGSMSDKDLEVTQFAMYQNEGNKKIGKFLLTIPGKSTSYVVTAPKHEVAMIATEDGPVLGKSTNAALYSMVESEMRRIYRFHNLTPEQRKQLPADYRGGANFFYFFPELNRNKTPEIWSGNKLLSEETLVTDSEGIERSVRSIIQSKVIQTVYREVDKKKADWERLGIVDKNKIHFLDKTYEQIIKDKVGDSANIKAQAGFAALDVVINEMLARVGMHQAFIGDPALFTKFKGKGASRTINLEATYDNLAKRLAKMIAPGLDIAEDSTNSHFYSIKANDLKAVSDNYKQILERIGEEKAKAHKEIEATDAQELTTLKEHITVMYGYGKIPTKMFKSLMKRLYDPDLVLSRAELQTVLDPMKPVYAETLINKELDIANEEYIKSSSFPLIPQLTKGLEIDKLRVAMEKLERDKKSTVRLAFKSGNKVGGVSYATIFNEDGTISDDLDLEPHTVYLPRSGFRIQMDLPFEEDKTESTRGSQETKLLFEGTLDIDGFKELKAKYDNAFKDLYQAGLDELHSEILTNGNLDIEKLRKILVNEATTRGYSANDIAYLNTQDGEFVINLWLGARANKFESLMLSLVTNKVIKRKTTGKSYVLGSEAGFKGAGANITYSNTYDPEKGLQPTRIVEVGEINDNSKRVILPIGTSGSGKSTWIKSLPKDKYIVISPDEMRIEFTGNIDDKSKDSEIYEVVKERTIKAVNSGKQVIIDSTNLQKERRRDFINAIKKVIPTVSLEYKLMELNPDLAKQRIKAQIERGENRANVPESTIDRHVLLYKEMLNDIKEESLVEFKENLKGNKKQIVLPAQVLVPWNFRDNEGKILDKKLFMTDGKIDFEKIPQELLQSFGFRIPTQGHNSLSYFEIVGFLPDVYDDLIIGPKDWVAQMGSDFDIDKLYSYMYNTYVEDGKLRKLQDGDEVKQSHIKLLQNEILDIHKSIVSHPEVFNRTITPLDFGDLSKKDKDGKVIGIAADISSAYRRREGGGDVNYLTSNYWRKKYMESIDGKSGVGVKALDTTFNSIVQQANPANDLHLLKVVEDDDGEKIVVNNYIVFGNEDYSRIELGNLSNPKTWRGKWKALVHSAYLSAAVDNEKDPILGKINSNYTTFNVERALAQVGFEEDHIAYFTSQPIIREYSELLRASRGSTSVFLADAKNTIIDDLLGKYQGRLVTKLGKEKAEERVKKLTADYPIVLSEMKGAVEREGFNGKYLTYEELQIAALLKFRKADGIGADIGEVQKAINSDSKGVGKNFFESIDKEERIRMLNGNNYNISNTDKLIGTFSETGSTIEPSTISGYASVYGTIEANRIFNDRITKPLFPYGSRGVVDTFREIERLTRKTLNLDSKREVFDMMKSYIYTKAKMGVGSQADRERLFYDREGNVSLAKRIFDFSKTPDGKNNAFILRLKTDVKTGLYPSTLKYTASKAENQDELNVYQGFIDLLRNHRELGEDLVKYAYLAGGIQGARNYIKYIPAQYLVNVGFAKETGNINLNDEQVLGNPLEDEDITVIGKFTLQYLQHNPNEVHNLPEDLKGIKVLEGTKADIKSFTATILDKDEKIIPIVSQYTATGAKNYRLFKLSGVDDKGIPVYTRIDVLGNDFYYEFNGDEQGLQRSGIERNQAGEIKVKANSISETLKTTNKDIENPTILDRFQDLEQSIENIQQSTNPSYKTLANFLVGIKPAWENTKFGYDYDQPTEGRFTPTDKSNWIVINPNVFTEGPKTLQGFERTILHETLHAVTSFAIKNRNVEGINLTTKQKRAISSIEGIRERMIDDIRRGDLEPQGFIGSELDEFSTLYTQFRAKEITNSGKVRLRELKRYYAFSDTNGESNLHEFVTEGLTSPEIQNLLNNIVRDSETTLLDRFIELVAKIIEEFNFVFNGEQKNINTNSELANLLGNTLILADTNLNSDQIAKKEIVEEDDDNDFFGGEINMNMYPDLSIGRVDRRFEPLINSIDDRIRGLERSITRARSAKNELRIRELEAQIASLEDKKEEIKEEATLGTLIAIGKRDLDEAEAILNQPMLSENDLEYAMKVVSLWEKANTLFSDKLDREQGGANQRALSALMGDASALKVRWFDIAKERLRKEVKDVTGVEVALKDLEVTKDIGSMTSLMMDISRSGNILLSAVSKWYKKAAFNTNQEARAILKDVDTLVEGVEKLPEFKKDGYYMLAQKYEDGRLTGNLVNPIKQEYWDEREIRRNRALQANSKNKSKRWSEYFKWKKENNIIFDTRQLYTSTEDGYVTKNNKEYINKLYKEVGDKTEVDEKLGRLNELIEQYNMELTSEKIRIADSEAPGLELAQWKQSRDPAIYLEGILDNNFTQHRVGDKFVPNKGYQYSVEIPSPKWKDKNYDKIKNTPELLKFYRYTIDTLNELYNYLPADVRSGLQYNTLPSIPLSIVEQYSQKGIKGAAAGLNDWFIDNITTSDIAEKTNRDIDPNTGGIVQELSVKYLNKLDPDEKSYDLGKVLKMFTMSALSYKHKSKVEDNIRLAQTIVNQMKEHEFIPTGSTKKDRFGKAIEREGGLTHLKNQLDYAIESFYGKRREVEGITKKKLYNSRDKAKKKELETQLAVSESIEEKAKIQSQIDKLGGNVTVSAVGDTLLQYIQIKGMGWNFLSGMVNAGYSVMSNMMWANGRTDFNLKNLWDANNIMLNSTLKSSTGDLVVNETSSKVGSLMVKFDVLKEINEAEYSGTTSNNKATKGIKKLAPYEMQRRSEFYGQGQTMVAMLLAKPIKNLKGEDKTYWDAYDKDGNWKTEEFGEQVEDSEFNFTTKLDQVLKSIHGNYDPNSPVLRKKDLFGRSLMQFRSWISEGVANRIEGKKYDAMLERTRKGRWRTYADLGALESMKTLLKQALYQKDALNGLDDPVDIENMRKNLAEIAQLLSLTGLYYLIKGMTADDDDEETIFVTNFFLNQINRLQTDILFYASPTAFENITRNALPAFAVIVDIQNVLGAAVDTMQGDGTYKTGHNAGRSKLLWKGSKLFPGATQIPRTFSIGEMVYNEL